MAYINDVPDGREHVRGCSEENALERLKDRINNYSFFNQFNYMPLTGEKQSELVSSKQARDVCNYIKGADDFHSTHPTTANKWCKGKYNVVIVTQYNEDDVKALQMQFHSPASENDE